MNPTKAWLEQKYIVEQLREYEIAALLPDYSAGEVRRYLRRFQIKRKQGYSYQFTHKIRPAVLMRDGNQCCLCNDSGKQVHHIDGDKQNNEIENLVTLCRQCHAWVGHRRTTWSETIKAFSDKGDTKQVILALLQKRQSVTYKELEKLHPITTRIHRCIVELERDGIVARHKDLKDKWRGPNWFTLI